MKKRKFSKLMIFILILILNVQFLIAQTNMLKVTGEHPFYVVSSGSLVVGKETTNNLQPTINRNSSWVKVKDLNLGDKLLTFKGEIAVIKKITKVNSSDSLKVYNLQVGSVDDYYANNILVHNKPLKKSGMELTDQQYQEILSERADLEELVSAGTKGIVKAEGSQKWVYILDPNKVPIESLPQNIKRIIQKQNNRIVIKYLKSIDDGGFNSMETMNIELEYRPKTGERFLCEDYDNPFPEMYYVRYTPGEPFIKEGIIIEEFIPERDVQTLREEFNNAFVAGDKETKKRVFKIAFKINKQGEIFKNNLERILKELGYSWRDGRAANIGIGFKDKAGNFVPVEKILSGEVNLDSVEPYYRIFEFGIVKKNDPGMGGLPVFDYQINVCD